MCTCGYQWPLLLTADFSIRARDDQNPSNGRARKDRSWCRSALFVLPALPFRHQLRWLFNALVSIISLSVCQHGLAIQGVSAPPCAMGWATQTTEHWVSCRADPWPSRAEHCRQSQMALGHRTSIASDFTIQIKKIASYWQIPVLPIGRIHARGCWLSLEGRMLVANVAYSSHTTSMSYHSRGGQGPIPGAQIVPYICISK